MVYILLAEGFEEAEALIPADLLRRAGLPVSLVGLNAATVAGGHGIAVAADLTLEQVVLSSQDMLLLPGGKGGVESMQMDLFALALIQKAHTVGCYLAAICAAPTLLAHLGLLDRRSAVCYPGMEEEMGSAVVRPECPVVVDGRIITGKTSDLLGSSAALLLNALKDLSGIEHDVHVLSPESIAPIQTLKTKYLGSKNPRLHTDEVLIALSATAAQSEDAQKALSCLPQLKGCQVHSSVMLSDVDRKMFQRLGCDLTCEPKFQ